MKVKFAGYKKRVSKEGKVGYQICLLQDADHGFIPLLIFSRGSSSLPYLSESSFNEIFGGLEPDMNLDIEVFFNQYGNIAAISF